MSDAVLILIGFIAIGLIYCIFALVWLHRLRQMDEKFEREEKARQEQRKREGLPFR